MSIYNCFVFDKGSEFARLQTVKEQSALVDTFSYMYPHLSASAFLHEYWYEDGAKIHIYMQISKLLSQKNKNYRNIYTELYESDTKIVVNSWRIVL